MKKVIFLLKILTICAISTVAYGQKISAIVADENSREVIADVFVFYDNSSTGGITDANGKFVFNATEFQNAALVFSHLNYELKTILVEDRPSVPDTIFLAATSAVLTEAVVVEKSKPRVRRRWLKRFTDEFLGADYDDKLIKIVNPEVLLFEEQKGKLTVESKESLIIENRFLGYRVKFFLQSFESYVDGDILYQGKVFFEEMKGTKKEKARFKRNRFNIYQRTSRKFFANLIQNKITDGAYEIGFSIFNREGDFINYEPIAIDSLVVNELTNGNYEIKINRALTITDERMKVRQAAQKVVGTTLSGVDDFKQTVNIIPRSYFWSKKGRIIVNQYGTISNPTEVEEAGYWTNFRVATLLPLDYVGKSRQKWRM